MKALFIGLKEGQNYQKAIAKVVAKHADKIDMQEWAGFDYKTFFYAKKEPKGANIFQENGETIASLTFTDAEKAEGLNLLFENIEHLKGSSSGILYAVFRKNIAPAELYKQAANLWSRISLPQTKEWEEWKTGNRNIVTYFGTDSEILTLSRTIAGSLGIHAFDFAKRRSYVQGILLPPSKLPYKMLEKMPKVTIDYQEISLAPIDNTIDEL